MIKMEINKEFEAVMEAIAENGRCVRNEVKSTDADRLMRTQSMKLINKNN